MHNFEESISGRSVFFKNNSGLYGPLFTTKAPEEWAIGLQKVGYATDPQYANKLISIMKMWGLE